MKRLLAFILPFIFISVYSFAYEDFHDLKNQADNGNAVAQYDLGVFFTGLHSQTDYKQALKYLRLSSKQGYTPAVSFLHDITSLGYNGWGDFDLLPWYDFGAMTSNSECTNIDGSMKGHAGASLLLAHSYYNQKKYAKALEYYNLALKQVNPKKSWWIAWEDSEAENGVATKELEPIKIIMDAITRIAYCYEHGYGVQKDVTNAIAYYGMFAGYDSDFGITNVECNTHICAIIKKNLLNYANPILTEYIGECGGQVYDGFAPCPEASRAWSKIYILRVKNEKAPSVIKQILNSFVQTQTDPNMDTSGQIIWNLWAAEIYYKGIGVDVNYSKAFKIFDYIANEAKGPWDSELCNYYADVYADACYRLYECYAYGRGVEKNSTKASNYFNEALINGSSSALYDDQKRYETLNN